MAKKLVQFEQLQKLTQGLYGKLHQELLDHDAKNDAHTTAITKALVQVNEDISKKANQTDLTALTGRVTTVEGAIDTINGSETTEGSIAKALKDAKGYADTQDGELHKTITSEINTAKTALQSNIDAKADAAAMETQLNAKADADDLTAEINRAKGEEQALAGRLNVIEGEAEGSIKKALADAKKYSDDNFVKNGTFTGLQEKVTTAESKITDLENAVGKDDQGKLIPVADQIANVSGDVTDLEGRVAQNETDIATIKGDYLKAADKTTLEGKITEAKEQADKGVTDAAKAQTTANAAKDKIDAFMLAADTGEKAIDTLKEIQNYITSDGTAAQKMTADIASKVAKTDYDAKVQELTAADTALGNRATALETLVGKAADGDQEATGLVKKVADNAAGIATNKSDIANLKSALGDVEHAASAKALEAVEGRVGTVETKVGDLETAVGKKAAGETPASGLYKEIADEAARAQGIEAGLRTDVNALKGTVGDASKGLVKDVADLKADTHTHANKAELDKFVTGDKAKLDDAVAKVTGNADTDGTIANAKKAGTDAQAAVNGLKLGVDLSDDTKAVVQLKTSADAVQNSIEIVYPYEFVSDQEIQTLIDGLGKQA